MPIYLTLSFVTTDDLDVAEAVRLATAAIEDEFDSVSFKAIQANDITECQMPYVSVPATDTSAKAPEAAKAVEALPFTVGQHLMAHGDRLTGEVTVEAVWDASAPHPKYNRPGQPYPQVEVKALRTNRKWHFNGTDINEGKLTLLS